MVLHTDQRIDQWHFQLFQWSNIASAGHINPYVKVEKSLKVGCSPVTTRLQWLNKLLRYILLTMLLNIWIQLLKNANKVQTKIEKDNRWNELTVHWLQKCFQQEPLIYIKHTRHFDLLQLWTNVIDQVKWLMIICYQAWKLFLKKYWNSCLF